GNLKHLADKRVIFRHQIVQCGYVFPWGNQQVHRRLWPKIFKCHHEVILMNEFCRRIVSDNSTKKARLLHGCNLALLGLLLCTTLLAGAHAAQESTQDKIRQTELVSYEGQTISSIELAGQPDLNPDEMMPLVTQRAGEEFSAAKIEQTLAALQNSGKYKE